MPLFGPPVRNPFSETQLKSLVADDLYWNRNDPDFLAYRAMADRAFANAFPGERKFDATGREVKDVAKVIDPSTFGIRPLEIGASVGRGASNRRKDVKKAAGVFKALGLMEDAGGEVQTLPELTSAIRGFQNMFGLKRDGLMKPEGETVRELTKAFGALQKKDELETIKRNGQDPLSSTQLKLAQADEKTANHSADQKKVSILVPSADNKPKTALDGKNVDNPWPKTPIAQEFRYKIHMKESQGRNYKEINSNNTAWGRYQMTEIALQDVGMMDAKKKWTGKYGINNLDEFLENREAQEKVFANYIARNRAQLKSKGALKNIGKKINGIEAEIALTESNLLAASHRKGAGAVNAYLNHMKRNGWVSNPKDFPLERKEEFLAIETRLREFQNISHHKKSGPAM